MAWKPKEKPLTAEEAVELARKELAPYWFGSVPQLAAIQAGKGATAHPIDPSFAKKVSLLLFIDPTRHSSVAVLRCAAEWHRRFHAHEFQVLVVFSSPYASLRRPELVQRQLEAQAWPMILVLDRDGLLSRAFGAVRESLPKAVLLKEGKVIFDHAGENWFDRTELQIQKILRRSDAGLPLAPPLVIGAELFRDGSAVDFGDASLYPKPGFIASATSHRTARFSEGGAKGREFIIGGAWVLEGERIITADPRAFLFISCRGQEFSLVAQALKTSAHVRVEVAGQPVFEEMCGPDLSKNDNGESLIQVTEARAYAVLQRLTEERRDVILRFPQADEAPVVLYGYRCGQSS